MAMPIGIIFQIQADYFQNCSDRLVPFVWPTIRIRSAKTVTVATHITIAEMETTTQSWFWQIFWACIFGIVLLFGLILEALAEKNWFRSIKSSRRWGSAKKLGERLVIIGVGGEVIVAGLAAAHEWALREAVTKIDPANRMITSVSANLFLVVRGTNGIAFDPDQFLNDRVFTRVRLGNLDVLGAASSATNGWDLGMFCVSAKSEIFGGAGGLTTNWRIQFEQNAYFPEFAGALLYGRDIRKWNVALVELPFLSSDTEIISGQLTLVAEPFESRTFQVTSKRIGSMIDRQQTIVKAAAIVVGMPGRWSPPERK